MNILLFGGRTSRPVSDYFKDRERQVRALINALKHQQLDEEGIKQRVVNEFTFNEININFQGKTLTVLHERADVLPVNGIKTKVILATYRQEVPFIGQRDILECSPIDSAGLPTFHGVPKIVDVNEQLICTVFETRKDDKQLMDYFGNESLGRYYDNQVQMNHNIREWNNHLINHNYK